MTDEGLAGVKGVRLIELADIRADNGRVLVSEFPDTLPFVVRRMFSVYDVPEAEARGTHAHRECEQLLMCLRGSVVALVDDGESRREVRLDRPTQALYMPKLTWGTQRDYSKDAMLMVLASDPYDADDYIHDYTEFLALVEARTT